MTGICTLLAGIATAVYKALGLDINLDSVIKTANQFKTLQDRFRQAAYVSALGNADDFKKEFDGLMHQMDALRASTIPPPERYFKKGQAKIKSGDYEFSVDAKSDAS